MEVREPCPGDSKAVCEGAVPLVPGKLVCAVVFGEVLHKTVARYLRHDGGKRYRGLCLVSANDGKLFPTRRDLEPCVEQDLDALRAHPQQGDDLGCSLIRGVHDADGVDGLRIDEGARVPKPSVRRYMLVQNVALLRGE